MAHPKRPSDKTYSDVMNEWAAQRNLLKADRSRILHPPYDASAGAKFLGYLMRIALVTVVPAGVYLFLVKQHLASNEFNTMISDGAAQTLEATTAETKGAGWKFDGLLTIKSLEAKGGPGAFYEQLEASNLSTRIPFGSLFKKEWILPRISMGELSIALRSGGLGAVPLYQMEDDGVQLPSGGAAPESPKTGAITPKSPRVMRAGFGINPDFKSLKFNAIQAARLSAAWGFSPAASGAVTGMQADVTRTAAGWVISGNNGQFRQGWMKDMKLQKLAVQLGSKEAVIDEAVLVPPGGGKGTLTGRMTLGEHPELDAVLRLEGVALHDLVPAGPGAMFTAEGKGSVKLSGSVNRSTGIRMEGDLEIVSGRMQGIPVLKALHQLTGEGQFRLLTLSSGRVQFTSSGAETGGGLLVEVREFSADCGPLARLRGTVRHEQIREAGNLDEPDAVERTKVTGSVRIGLSSGAVEAMKPGVRDQFLKKDEAGWFWLEIPVDGPINSDFSKEIADQLLKAAAKEA